MGLKEATVNEKSVLGCVMPFTQHPKNDKITEREAQ